MKIRWLLDKWMHFKRGFVYTIKEAETSIGNNEVSRDMIPYIFFKETQRKILRLNKTPPSTSKFFLKRGGVIKPQNFSLGFLK